MKLYLYTTTYPNLTRATTKLMPTQPTRLDWLVHRVKNAHYLIWTMKFWSFWKMNE